MLLLDGTLGAHVSLFLTRLQEENILPCPIILYESWHTTHTGCNNHDHNHPEGIIYLRVSPEIAYARIKQYTPESEISITLDYIEQVYAEKEQLFIENKNSPKELEHLPVLVLNGNIDFQTDFAQYYNHIFYIKKFLQDIEKRKQIMLGTYKDIHHRRCC